MASVSLLHETTNCLCPGSRRVQECHDVLLELYQEGQGGERGRVQDAGQVVPNLPDGPVGDS